MGRVLVLTSNVGSLFEAGQRLHEPWTETVLNKFEAEQPDVAVIHMQETGGKNYEACSWQAPKLIEELISKLPDFNVVNAYLDIEYEVPTFTALGQIVLIRKSISVRCAQYDFGARKYVPVKPGVNIITSGLADSTAVIKRKFPKTFWPGIKWGRKGFLHSRWRLFGRYFDFVNVHLFHDESNIAVIHENPALYSANRKRALNFVLEHLKESENGHLPLVFIFGDLNFRLHSPSFLMKLTDRSNRHMLDEFEETHASTENGLCVPRDGKPTPELLRRTVSAIEFRRNSKASEIERGCVLRIEKKRFDYFNHKMLLNDWKDYLEDDKEAKEFKELKEFSIEFPPTYPWSEDPDDSDMFMKTRAPAWCDRVLMNNAAYALAKLGLPKYGSIGRNKCTGDHKPVALVFDVDAPLKN